MFSSVLRHFFINLDLILQGLTLLGLILCVTRWKKWGQRLVMITLIPLFVIVLTPFGPWMMTHLERNLQSLSFPRTFKGLIVAGETFSQECETLSVSNFLKNVQREETCPILVITETPLETAFIKRFFEEQGLNQEEILFQEGNSLEDNARKSYAFFMPGHEKWGLIAEEAYMKRVVTAFEDAGWAVVPYSLSCNGSESYILKSWQDEASPSHTLTRMLLKWKNTFEHFFNAEENKGIHT
jgi:uncharacterized SAM-binding protein YcdF (DUF218 family)